VVVGQARVLVVVATTVAVSLVCVNEISARVVSANFGQGVTVLVAAYEPETVVVTVRAVEVMLSVATTVVLVAGALVDVIITVKGIFDVTCGATSSRNERM
jgi:hypothetical protein